MMVATFFMSPSLRTEVNRSIAFRYWSLGMPVIRSTASGVYREYCCFINWKTHRGSCSVGLAAEVSALLIIPRSVIVDARRGVESRVQAILGKLESLLHDEGG